MPLTDSGFFTLKLCTALGCGLVAGAFFAFSTFVMQALGQQPPAQGIATMQSINITVINPWFMGVLFGTAVGCLGLVVFSLTKGNQPGAKYLLLGSLLYLLGTILVTIAFNVPLNDALAAVNPASAEGATLWAKYLTNWTLWNHLRTVAALAAAALLTLSLIP
ncbi:anthrone oxygenase family protein [Leptolyngbya sp. CCNP1308]|uniref:anthrone oxygenase family protein n=1 Tax=Leptolyngbya sp. CCNP1308 TaxID=3110255 RepID=UPI002B1E9D84|nr:anthrone oxygenase family protein [Leptolyngbya sp. CCNP1308]MEA5451056.1 anthrone oxygenase family protein [Leptolyngbya sp. CCNP1308]